APAWAPGRSVALGRIAQQCLNVTTRFYLPSNCQFLAPGLARRQLSDDKITKGLLNVCIPRIRLSRTRFPVPRHVVRAGRSAAADHRNLQRSLRGTGL